MKNFETLKEEFPIFVVKNRKSIAKNILLANNEEVTVPENATVRLESRNLIQMPDATIFRVLEPTLDDLIAHNVIANKTEEKKPDANDPSAVGKSGGGNGGKS